MGVGLPQLFLLSSIVCTLLWQASVLELPLWGLTSLLPGLRLDSDFPLTASDALGHPWLLPPAEQLRLAILVLPAVQVHPASQKSMDACVMIQMPAVETCSSADLHVKSLQSSLHSKRDAGGQSCASGCAAGA